MRRRGALSFARHSTSDTGLELETGLIGGVEERELIVVPYQPEWADAFRLHAERISAALGSVALAFEHIGSTSVPRLSRNTPTPAGARTSVERAHPLGFVPWRQGRHLPRMRSRDLPYGTILPSQIGHREIDRNHGRDGIDDPSVSLQAQIRGDPCAGVGIHLGTPTPSRAPSRHLGTPMEQASLRTSVEEEGKTAFERACRRFRDSKTAEDKPQ